MKALSAELLPLDFSLASLQLIASLIPMKYLATFCSGAQSASTSLKEAAMDAGTKWGKTCRALKVYTVYS